MWITTKDGQLIFIMDSEQVLSTKTLSREQYDKLSKKTKDFIKENNITITINGKPFQSNK